MPPAYTTSQKALIAQFVAVTGTDRTQAARSLKSNGWNIDEATNGWFGHTPANAAHKAALEGLFEKYRSKGKNATMMDTDAVQHYFKDIGVNLEDITCFIASQIVQCPSLGEMTKEGFVTGWSELNCETVAKQKTHITTCKKQVGDPTKPELLDKVYKYTFKLLLQGPGQRIVDKDTCISLWRILFVPPSLDWSTPRTKWLDVWCQFIEERSSAKGINADLWNQVLKFAKSSVADDTLGFWNEEQSWPALIDEFVAYVKETRGDSVTAGGDEMEIE